jgi:hypothetical protein
MHACMHTLTNMVSIYSLITLQLDEQLKRLKDIPPEVVDVGKALEDKAANNTKLLEKSYDKVGLKERSRGE